MIRSPMGGHPIIVPGPVGSPLPTTTRCGLTSVSFPKLTTVKGDLDVSYEEFLTSLSFPELTTVEGNFVATGNSARTSISTPQLQGVGGLAGVYGNHPDLGTCPPACADDPLSLGWGSLPHCSVAGV